VSPAERHALYPFVAAKTRVSRGISGRTQFIAVQKLTHIILLFN
jgi:hypothetical protein